MFYLRVLYSPCNRYSSLFLQTWSLLALFWSPPSPCWEYLTLQVPCALLCLPALSVSSLMYIVGLSGHFPLITAASSGLMTAEQVIQSSKVASRRKTKQSCAEMLKQSVELSEHMPGNIIICGSASLSQVQFGILNHFWIEGQKTRGKTMKLLKGFDSLPVACNMFLLNAEEKLHVFWGGLMKEMLTELQRMISSAPCAIYNSYTTQPWKEGLDVVKDDRWCLLVLFPMNERRTGDKRSDLFDF